MMKMLLWVQHVSYNNYKVIVCQTMCLQLAVLRQSAPQKIYLYELNNLQAADKDNYLI